MRYYKSSLLLLKLLHVTLLHGLHTKKHEVTGYVGSDVKLPCHITEEKNYEIIQVEWRLLQPGNETVTIVVSKSEEDAPGETFLKDRVKVVEQSLMIRNVTMQDEGSYTCLLTTFPSGSLKGTTYLVVRDAPEQMSLSSGAITAIVISAILLLVILTALAYFIFLKRLGSFARHHIAIDTDAPVRDVLRPSILVKEQDVVYSDIKKKPSRVTAPSSSVQHAKAVRADDVTYSEIIISRGQYV